MTTFTPHNGLLHYTTLAKDGAEIPTSVPDTLEAREYLSWCHRAPMRHQVADVLRFRDREFFALFHEQRVRKTKIVLDIFRRHWERGEASFLIVMAWPNGVQHVWRSEIEQDFPPDVLAATRCVVWQSGRMASRAAKAELDELATHSTGPCILALNCDALKVDQLWKYLDRITHRRKVMAVADESDWAANWTARTRRLEAIGRRPNVRYRAILTGTPVDEAPTDVWHQFQFLHPGLLGFADKNAFRNRYCAYEEEEYESAPAELDPATFAIVRPPVMAWRRKKGGRFDPKTRKPAMRYDRASGNMVPIEYDILKGYVNLDELSAKIDAVGSRVLRRDVSDAPPQIFQSRVFEMTAQQRAVYDDLRSKYVAELSGVEVEAELVLKRMIRLQQVARGYWPPEREGVPCVACAGDDCPKCDGLGRIVRLSDLRRIEGRQPAQDALVAELVASRGPCVVWARYHPDVLDVLECVRRARRNPFHYSGLLRPAECEAHYLAFRASTDPRDAIVSTTGSGLTRGHDLTRATTIIFYSNSFSLRHRRQAQDRAESLDRTFSTDVVDIVAAGTRDEDIIEALRHKHDLARIVMRDPVERWL